MRQSDNICRLQDRYADAQRKLNIAEAEEAALRAQLKTAETTIHKLKDEAARTKKLVAETRAACANEVRKRDRQIDGLKKAVADAGRARGERKSPGITTIHVTGEIGADHLPNTASTMDEDYDLRQETNSFLAQLAKGLSEENETLLSLVHKTNASLKTMSGWDKSEAAAATARISDGHAVRLSTNPEDLAADIDSVLDHLRNMLTNPSFVPLEEVVVREEEIFRLRDGWEKMEIRWREAVSLIDGWRRRMAADGQPVNMEELKMGLRLSPVRVQSTRAAQVEPFKLSTLLEEEEEEERSSLVQQPESPSPAESLHLVPAEGYQEVAPEYEEEPDHLDNSDSESSIFEDDVDVDMDELQAEEPNVEILARSAADTTEDSISETLPPPPKITPLEETRVAGNRKPGGTTTQKSRKRSGNLMDDDSVEEAKAPPVPPHGNYTGQSPQKRLKVAADVENERPKSRPNSGIFNDANSSGDSVPSLEPSTASTTTKASSKTTERSTRSGVTSKKTTAAPARPAVRASRQVSQGKKETPPTPLTRQRTTRATAATASSSSRAGSSKTESSRTRPAADSNSTSTTDMPPPPRPTRAAKKSPANPPTPLARVEKMSSSADKKSSPVEKQTPPLDTSVPAETASTSSTKCQPESPVRSTPKSSSRLPLPRNAGILPQPQQSPVTVAGIAAKLAASEREANAARVKAKLRAARLGKSNATTSSATSTIASSVRVVSGDPVKRDRDGSGSSTAAAMSGRGSDSTSTQDENGHVGGVSIMRTESASAGSSLANEAETGDTASPQKRRKRAAQPPSPEKGQEPKTRKREARSRAEKNASRRRSTLSPWELQSLIAGEVVPPTPGAPE